MEMAKVRINRTPSLQLPLWVESVKDALHFRWKKRRACPTRYMKKEIRTVEDGFDRVLAFIRRHAERKTYVLVVDGRAKCMNDGSRKIKYFQNNHDAVLIGIYDGSVEEDWLLDDLRNAGASA
jgi:hypothetical protein